MVLNYLKVGIRNTLRHKLFSLINILGLAIAMTVCLLVIMLLSEQFEYDRFHSEKARVYRVLSKRPDGSTPYASTPPSLAASLRAGYAPIEACANLVTGVGGDAVVGDKAVEMRGFFADEHFFKVLGFKLQDGDSRTALAQPHTIVISKAIAAALFEDGDAVGKTVNFYDRGLHYLKEGKDTAPVSWGSFTITGVLDQETAKSHLRFDVLMSSTTQRLLLADGKSNDSDGWDHAFSYILAAKGQSEEAVNASLTNLFESRFASNEDLKGFSLACTAFAGYNAWHTGKSASELSTTWVAFYVLAFVALMIMGSACLNYANLSTARALTRLKEIGIRKVSGAHRRDLILQFLTESMLTTALALSLATGMLYSYCLLSPGCG